MFLQGHLRGRRDGSSWVKFTMKSSASFCPKHAGPHPHRGFFRVRNPCVAVSGSDMCQFGGSSKRSKSRFLVDAQEQDARVVPPESVDGGPRCSPTCSPGRSVRLFDGSRGRTSDRKNRGLSLKMRSWIKSSRALHWPRKTRPIFRSLDVL